MKVNRKRLFLVIGLSLFTLLLVGVVSAQTGGGYDLTWWTVDGGGGSLSGGGYTLMGTAGQPDAGSVGGGGYTLSGGFWAGRGGGAVCTALTGVSVSGPSSGNTGETLTFTATPSPTGATTPITYTWSSDGLVNANGNQATYRWDDTGTKTVQVTARNCGGQDFSASAQVNITSACVGVTGASITGLTTGYTGVQYDFVGSYEPPTATAPLTYTWSPTPLGEQGTLTATYSWATTGTHTISFTVQNCGGVAIGTHSISISEPPTTCEAVTGVTIAGPASGELDTDYTFTATVQPADASTPIDYVWSSDNLTGGQGTAYATYHWSQAGTYTITVLVGNCGGSANASQPIVINSGDKYIYLPLVVRNH
ncbi:MAG: hypothetical protein DRI77_02755 [Chloroflexi bacterium]|nr:MAG: hypothetical protein DRI77_02755 [Chloroflexota bacterium]